MWFQKRKERQHILQQQNLSDNDTDNNKNIKEEKRNRNCGHFIFKNRVDIAMNEPISIQIQIQIETNHHYLNNNNIKHNQPLHNFTS
jgi:hypothetical protein